MLLVTTGLASCSASVPPSADLAPPQAGPAAIVLPASPLTADEQILHVLDRLGHGPRPGDLERVRRLGLAEYIQQQLDPASIADPAVERRLWTYPVLTMTTAELIREYPRPGAAVRPEPARGPLTPRVSAAAPPDRGPSEIITALRAARLTRAILSERQLQEVMVDF